MALGQANWQKLKEQLEKNKSSSKPVPSSENNAKRVKLESRADSGGRKQISTTKSKLNHSQNSSKPKRVKTSNKSHGVEGGGRHFRRDKGDWMKNKNSRKQAAEETKDEIDSAIESNPVLKAFKQNLSVFRKVDSQSLKSDESTQGNDKATAMVDLKLLKSKRKETMEKRTKQLLSAKSSMKKVTEILALDCEMVGAGEDGALSILARVVIVNNVGNIIYDRFVKPKMAVSDFRTHVSGILPHQVYGDKAVSLEQVQQEVHSLIAGRTVVGHDLRHDFEALLISHPRRLIRDTARYRPLMRDKRRPHSLKYLSGKHLKINIQKGEHDPGDDAKAALLLYKKFRMQWEQDIIDNAKQKKVTNKNQSESSNHNTSSKSHSSQPTKTNQPDNSNKYFRPKKFHSSKK